MKKMVHGSHMAKRLSKALREKRRWMGMLIDRHLADRSSIERTLEQLSESIATKPSFRLMDFYNHDDRSVLQDSTELSIQHPEGGLAIVRTPLSAAVELRGLLEADDALEVHGMISLTTSGKIRLVRHRLGLPKPRRKRP